MSYDIRLICNSCRHDLYGGGVTFNLSKMLRAAGAWKEELNNTEAPHAAVILKGAIDELKSDPEKYRKMESPNGWGTYDQAVGTLENLLNECERNPDSVLYMD